MGSAEGADVQTLMNTSNHNLANSLARSARAVVLSVTGMVTLLGAPQLSLADTLPPNSGPLVASAAVGEHGCEASTPQEARALGDLFYQQGAYQHAGACYEAAGEHDLANRAYLKAVGPAAEASAKQLADNRNVVKAQFQQMRKAFHSSH